MKKWILVIFAVLWLFPAAAQSAREVILAQPDKAGGVYAMYEQEPGAESRPPKGYKPFYISHYGRHGARYLLSDKEYVRVLDLFAKAHSEGELTEAGENLHERLQAYYKQMQYRDGELSRYGWEQHQFIARQLYAAYPELFRLRPRVEAASTLYLRTLMSMNAFCTALQGCDSRLPLYAEGSRLNLNGICPHLKDNPFPQGEGVRFDIDDPWGGNVKRFAEENEPWESLADRYFRRRDWLLAASDPTSFVRNLHTLVFNSTNVPTDISFADVFTPEEAYRAWRVENYRYWLGLGPLNTSEIPLVAEIIRTADRDIAAGEPLVRLRFGHDSSFMAMLSLFGIDTFGQMPASADEIEELWRCYRIPMGCNYRFVFYRNKAGEVLFKFVLNGSDAKIPALTPVEGCFYRWSDFRARMAEKYRFS